MRFANRNTFLIIPGKNKVVSLFFSQFLLPPVILLAAPQRTQLPTVPPPPSCHPPPPPTTWPPEAAVPASPPSLRRPPAAEMAARARTRVRVQLAGHRVSDPALSDPRVWPVPITTPTTIISYIIQGNSNISSISSITAACGRWRVRRPPRRPQPTA
jgi:hypothetical protein